MMTLSVNIESTKVAVKAGKNERGEWKIGEQLGYCQFVDTDGQPKKYPQEVKVPVDFDPSGNPVFYPVGQYVIDPQSFYVGQYGTVLLGRVKLLAIKPVK